jgi:hypothetical protein
VVSTFNRIGGKVVNLLRYVDKEDKTWSAFNPSICKSPDGKYAIGFRSSNYIIQQSGELRVTTGGPIRNQVWFADIDEDFELSNLRKIDFKDSKVEIRRGVEDPKLLWRNNRWEFTGVMCEKHTPIARHCYCSMDKKATTVTKIEIHPGASANKPEKNWATAAVKPKNFDYIYGPNAVVVKDKVVTYLGGAKELSGIRGNTHLLALGDGTYLAVVHRLYAKPYKMYDANRFGIVDAMEKNYHHFFIRYDEHGKVIEISSPFQFISAGIEFAAGIVEMGDDYVISFGKNDLTSHIGVISKAKVKTLLRPVKT